MKKQLYLFLTLSLIGSYAYAQVDSYDISTYKTADYSRKAIDLTANGAGSLSSQYGANSPEERNFSGDLKTVFSMDKISRTTDQKTTIELSIAGDYKKSSTDRDWYYLNFEDDKNETKQNSYNLQAFIERKSLFYNEDDNFFELSPSVSFGYGKRFDRIKGLDTQPNIWDYNYDTWQVINSNTNRRATTFSISTNIGAGMGRIENVTDARHALFVLEELKKQGILKKDLSQDQINELASVITRAKNKRQFDSRIKLIDEIASLDSALVANDYVDQTDDITYYTSLYDKWMYGGRFTRLSGSRISLGLKPYYSFNEDKEVSHKLIGYRSNNPWYTYTREINTREKNINSHYGIGAYADFTYEKPASKKLQQSLLLRATAYTQNNRNVPKNSEGAAFFGSYAWGYYPNTRTHVQLAISEQLAWNDLWIINDNPLSLALPINREEVSSQTQLSLNAYYYLSPQVRLGGYCGFDYVFYKSITDNKKYYDKYPSPYFNFSVQYSIF